MDRITSRLAIVACTLALSPPLAQAVDTHAHAPGAAASSALQLDNGRKWATDAPLRGAMSRIRNAVAAASPAVHAGKAKPAQYAALGSQVEREAGRIVAECKLEPKADAMLHLVVADLVAGADALKAAKSGAQGREGVLTVASALDAYGKYFEDTGYKPLGH